MARIVSFSVPEEEYLEINSLQKDAGFSGRSETIRAAMHYFGQNLAETKTLKGSITALLVLSHPHANNIDEIVHLHEGEVITRLHQHVGNKCLDIFLLKGDAEAIRSLMKTISKNKKVSTSKLLII
jgi:CopG family nickel-responsive transcriptional regulator